VNLTYLNFGERDYEAQPVHPYRRAVWEFQAIVSGSVLATLPDRPPVRLRAPVLTLFDPSIPHGWFGTGGTCRILVFHYREVPAPLPIVLGEQPFLAQSLTRRDARYLLKTAEQLAEMRKHPGPLLELRSEQARLELSLTILRDWERKQGRQPIPEPATRIDQIRTWFANHLHEQVGVAEACRQFAISPAHLRRLFHQQTGKSPQEALEEIKMLRAKEMVRDGREKLETIAESCGYGSASALSRAYRNFFGAAPRTRKPGRVIEPPSPVA